MRFIDLALATMVGVSAIGSVLVLNPSYPIEASSRYSSEAGLRDSLVRIVQSRGLEWFVEAPSDTICGVLASVSNSSVGYGATIGNSSCGPSPPVGATEVELALTNEWREVTLWSWRTAGG